MTLEHLNYCRQMTKQFMERASDPAFPENTRERMLHCITLAANSQKFILPHGGYLIDDQELRALDESERLRLPYPSVALEYQCAPADDGMSSSTKRIVFASEIDGGIAFRCVAFADTVGVFFPFPAFMLEHGNYLRRDLIIDGVPSLLVRDMGGANDRLIDDGEREDCLHEARALLGFMNALACSNVHYERSEPKKAGKKIKSALPFDTYHVLTIDVPGRPGGRTGADAEHRSPREHLRRGHIRRLADGRRIWVNATVVSAGRGGTVNKDYALRRAA